MAPEIRYARAADGVSIAYYAAGSGPALINLPAPPYGNVQLMSSIAEWRDRADSVTRVLTFIQYDPRGFGMSDRDVTDFSLEAMVLDLEAVVDALELERFAITTWTEMSMPVLVYAARHPDRVIALNLREGIAEGSPLAYFDELTALARDNWNLCKQRLADGVANIMTVVGLAQLHRMIEQTTTQDAYLRYTQQMRRWDAREVLSSVTMPVLVTNDGFVSKEDARWLAAALPQGSFVISRPARGERSPAEDAMREFLGRAFAAEPPRRSTVVPSSPAAFAERVETGLTPREIEVLRLVIAGKSGREIAGELVVSPRTVERHIANIYRKTSTHSRAQLAAFAVRHGLG